MFNKQLLLFLLLFTLHIAIAQKKDRKKITATRITKAPKIDGILNDIAWKNAKTCKDFIVFRPNNGKAVSNKYTTEVKVVYDDNAIYISAKMLDPEPENIPQEFSTRDNFSQADFFLVTINPNDDGQNPFQFIVQVTGNQGDAKISNGNEDFNWSAVWESDVKITDYGWNVEMKIPYRALRFSNQEVQSWGFNFHRRLERINEQHTWNYINNSQGMWTQYDGLITNFKNISPPTRLNFYPYASATTTTFKGKTDFDWNAGMDIKYGLSENFTLDATLIPDFSQAGFDNVELNLGPFEQKFSEQRQFFTEGTELFTKGNLFYSRRIGSTPIKKASINTDETFIENPEKVTMLNAIKVSGRTKGGLGIGVFNAITQETKAKIKNNRSNEIREEITNPFSNYNILVADYQFNKNSAVTLINTNVTRNGNFRDANVTGLLWHIEDKSSTYNIDGSFKISNITDVTNPTTGFMFDTSIGKNSGKWFWELGYNFENKDYDPNDMGILFSNNEQAIYGNVGYRILKPKGNFNNYGINLWNNALFQHYSGKYMGYSGGINFWANTKSRFNFGANINIRTKKKDFNEPRQENLSGIYFERPMVINLNHWGNTNSQKKLKLSYYLYYGAFSNDKKSFSFQLSPRYRFNNQFSLGYSFNYGKTNNDQGYVNKIDNDIIFGQRDRKRYTNSISSKYNFSTKSSLSLTFRHYWASVAYDEQYYSLNANNGSLQPYNNYTGKDVNFNSWNLDLNYIWQFAPGSQLIALYRNSIFSNDSNTNLNFTNNLNNLFKQSNKNTVSVRFVYFIDYNNLKKLF